MARQPFDIALVSRGIPGTDVLARLRVYGQDRSVNVHSASSDRRELSRQRFAPSRPIYGPGSRPLRSGTTL